MSHENNKARNFYTILGVPHNASLELITAAYKAMVKSFHPDTFRGDKVFAEMRLKEINLAYENLKTPEKRREHDEYLNSSQRSKDNNHKSHSSSEESKWERVCDFFPELHDYDRELSLLNRSLSAEFRKTVMEEKAFSDALSLKEELISSFAQKMFGSNEKIREVGLKSLELGHKGFALSLNKALSLVGEDSSRRIFLRLAEESPREAEVIYRQCGLESMLSYAEGALSPGLYEIKGKLGFRILPNLSVVVFEKDQTLLLTYEKYKNVLQMLEFYGESWSSISKKLDTS